MRPPLMVTVQSGVAPMRKVGDFDRFKLMWLSEVHRRTRVSDNDFYVAYSIFEKFVSGVDLDFDASIEDMRTVAGISRRSMQKTLRRLESLGLLKTTIRYGRATVNTYSFMIPSGTSSAPQSEENAA